MLKYLSIFSLCVLCFVYGLATISLKIFPYELVRHVKNGFDAFMALDNESHLSAIKWFDENAPATPKITRYPGAQGQEALLITGGFYQYMDRCPTFGCLAWIIDREGNVLHSWEVDPQKIIQGGQGFSGDLTQFNVYPIGLALGSDGSLVVTFQGRNIHPYKVGIAKLSLDGAVLWKKLDYAHHWPDVAEDGTIYAASSRDIPSDEYAKIPFIYKECKVVDTVHYEGVRVYRPDGSVSHEFWLQEAFAESDWQGALYYTDPCDPVHINSVEIVSPAIAAQLPGVEAGDLLTSSRSPGAVAIMDSRTGAIKQMSIGRVVMQHSPKFLPDATVAVFDNQGGKEGGLSRIVRLNLRTNEAETLFPRKAEGPAIPFESVDGGHLEVSPDGSRIIVASMHQARIFEFDVATGDVLWQMDHCMDISAYLDKFDLRGKAEADRACFRTYGAYYVEDLAFLATRTN